MGDMRLGKTAWSAGGGTKFSQVQLFSLYAAQQRTARRLTVDTKIDRIAASDRSWPGGVSHREMRHLVAAQHDCSLSTLFGHCCLHGTAGSAVSGILGFVPAAAQVSPGTIGGPFKQEEADGDITL
jgi:hypothetical protein